jgi:hypothetical protein
MHAVDEVDSNAAEKPSRVLLENSKAVPLAALRSQFSRANELSAFFDRIVLVTPGKPGRDF